MYKILNKLFGWDYVYFEYGGDGTIRRVRILHNGQVGYWCYGRFYEINRADEVLWLTCHPSKYDKE